MAKLVRKQLVVAKISSGEEVIEMYLEAWQTEGEPIPKPNTLQIA